MTSEQLPPLEQFLTRIELYRTGDIRLHTLVSDLSYLHDSIDSQGDAWKRSVWEKIGDLEQVNAVMLDKGMTEIDETGRKIVDQAIRELVGLLDKARTQTRQLGEG